MEPVTDETLARARDAYLRFAEHEAEQISPLYADWARGIVGDEALLDLIAGLPRRKRQPNLVFAAARMSGVQLGAWSDVRGAFSAAWPAIRAQALVRSTQTNEPLRMATLLPALAGIRGDISLVEIGASAGLCLYPDRWRYRFGPGRYAGDANRPLLETDASASVPVPARLPRVAWRGGIDLNPLSPSDADTKDWLEALIWPNAEGRVDEERVDRLRTGIAIARREPAHIIAGDLRERTRDLILEARGHADKVVVWHSAVLAYLDMTDRVEFSRLMAELDVTWVSNEGALVTPGRPAPWATAADFVLRVDGEPLAVTHPYGRSITWHTDIV